LKAIRHFEVSEDTTMPKSNDRPELPPPQISSDDLPLSEIEISGIHFHIEFVDVPGAKERY
jgi:hypothetical protein